MSKIESLSDLVLDRYYKITPLEEASGIPGSSIRAAYVRGDIPGVRTRPSCNAPVRIRARDFLAWLERCTQHRRVLSPAETSEINHDSALQ